VAALALTAALHGCRRERDNPTPNRATSEGQALFLRDQTQLDFVHDIGPDRPLNIIQTTGSGCAFVDLTGDRLPDILLLDSDDWQNPQQARHHRLYRNLGGRRFQDISAGAGLDVPGAAMCVAGGDIDRDGDLDLFIGSYGPNALLLNDGQGRFRNVTQQWGLTKQPGEWTCAAAFADVDNDGWDDLFIGNYCLWDPAKALCLYAGDTLGSCPPFTYAPQRSYLYRNTGRGRFEDISARTPLPRKPAHTLSCCFFDYDGDGRLDLFIGNDGDEDYLFRNQGGGAFADMTGPAGVGFAAEGRATASMGVDVGDLDNEGHWDMLIGTFQGEASSLWRGSGERFDSAEHAFGVATVTQNRLTWGLLIHDFDADGDDDALLANGHVNDTVSQYEPSASYRQPVLYLENMGRRFTYHEDDVFTGNEAGFVGRGAAGADGDNDGRMDVVINNCEGSPLLLWNQMPLQGNVAQIALRGVRSSPLALGAEVTWQLNGRPRLGRVRGGGSYGSQSDLPLLVTLGQATSLETLTVRWSVSGAESFGPLRAGRRYLLVEGSGPPQEVGELALSP